MIIPKGLPSLMPETMAAAPSLASTDEQCEARVALVCPKCQLALDGRDSRLHCARCLNSWPVVDGVPDFEGDFPYWGEIPLKQMREVNRIVRTAPWRETLLESPEAPVRRASEMILNLDRANWQKLLELSPDSRVLDIGAGMGTNSHALAMQYREVLAVEPVLERIQFMQQRFAQEKLSNVRLVRSSVWDLPFPAASFDLVAMNGVLEWVAEGQSEDPRTLQQRALRNVFKMLRPDGYLYLGIENRLALGYFMGYPDPHCGLPYVTVLPRFLAHWYAKRKGHENGYRNYLYSSRGYKKLLTQAGFSRIEVYLALPSYNFPRYLIPLSTGVFPYYCRNFTPLQAGKLRRMAHRLLLRSGLLQHCEYSFVILARK